MFQRSFTELRAAPVPVSLKRSIAIAAFALTLASTEAVARRPSPPGYESLGHAVSQSSGYWVWAQDHRAVTNADTGLRCPHSVGAYQIERLSSNFDRQFRSASCIYANAAGRMFSVSRSPRETADAEICEGSLRHDEHLSVLAVCVLQGETRTSVVAGASRPPAELERAFVSGVIQATGNG